jgi:hypothetical protein
MKRPLTAYAKDLAILEAFVGQIYVAAFTAQLVGMRLAERLGGKGRDISPLRRLVFRLHSQVGDVSLIKKAGFPASPFRAGKTAAKMIERESNE